MSAPIFNQYGAAPLITTTFGCLAATYDAQTTSYRDDLETEGYLYKKLDDSTVEIVSPRLRLFWLDPMPSEANEVGEDEEGQAEAECKLEGAPLFSVGLVSLEDDFVGQWWLDVLTGETRSELHQSLSNLVEDQAENIACRAAAASILAKLDWPIYNLPQDIISYMLDCRVALNSLEFRMENNCWQLVQYVAKEQASEGEAGK